MPLFYFGQRLPLPIFLLCLTISFASPLPFRLSFNARILPTSNPAIPRPSSLYRHHCHPNLPPFACQAVVWGSHLASGIQFPPLRTVSVAGDPTSMASTDCLTFVTHCPVSEFLLSSSHASPPSSAHFPRFFLSQPPLCPFDLFLPRTIPTHLASAFLFSDSISHFHLLSTHGSSILRHGGAFPSSLYLATLYFIQL